MEPKRATLELIATVLLGLSLGAVGMITCETAAAWVGELIHLIRYGI